MQKQSESPSNVETGRAIKVNHEDNVATALNDLAPGKIAIIGEKEADYIQINESIHAGHKVALCGIEKEKPVMKFGAVIGWASQSIQAGDWIHLHNCRSGLDERSSSLDVQTGEPSDTPYE